MRCSLRTGGVIVICEEGLSQGQRQTHTPFTLEHEIRRLCSSSRSSSFNKSCSSGWSLASSPLKQAPYFRQHMMVAAKAFSFWALCSCGVSWWKLLPRPPLDRLSYPHRKWRCAAHLLHPSQAVMSCFKEPQKAVMLSKLSWMALVLPVHSLLTFLRHLKELTRQMKRAANDLRSSWRMFSSSGGRVEDGG